MNIVRFQGETPSVYYEFDRDSLALGEGGMGRIYQGYRVDTAYNFQTLVAIKCIRAELSGNATIIQRAQKEASVQIDDEHLIRMYGFFSGAEYNAYTGGYTPTYYIAMERLVGINLDEILFKGMTSDKSGLPVEIADELYSSYSQDREKTVRDIMLSVVSGVSVLHKFGFIHRDLDPSNVMLTQEGKIKVIDFGISKRVGSSSSGSGLTQAGQFLGKVAYAAPELILGDLKSQSAATDVYALGIMLYQFLTGFLPSSGSDQEVMDAHLRGELDFSAVKNRQLREVIVRATKKELADRFSTADELLEALNNVDFSAVQDSDDVDNASKTVPFWIYPVVSVVGLAIGAIVRFLI